MLGVDLTRLDDEQWDALYATWLEHLVLFFPGQSLDADAHVALGRRFGTPEIHPYIPKRDDDHPEIVVIDTVGGGAEFWHTDVTFSPTPPMASILQMIVNPPRGGDTIFTNQYLAYEMLSDPMRDLLDGLTAVHTAAPFGHPEQNAAHPVVRTHPDTGRKSLFVNRTFTSHIVELHRSESDALLDYLYTWSEQPRFQCRYRVERGHDRHLGQPLHPALRRARLRRATRHRARHRHRRRTLRWRQRAGNRSPSVTATSAARSRRIRAMEPDPRANSMSK